MTAPDLRALLGNRYDDVIETAARAMQESDGEWTWERLDADEPVWAQGWRDNADAALSAVLPDMLAAAWDEGHAAGDYDYGTQIEAPDWPDTPNPYYRAQPAADGR